MTNFPSSLHLSLALNSIFATLLVLVSTGASAQNIPKPELPTLELSAEASRSLPNDLAAVQAYVEQTDAVPADLAKRVNQRMTEALALVKAYPSVKVKTSGSQTTPVYTPKTPGHIEAWHMRSSISLESRDIGALSELVGKLQTLLAVGQLSIGFAPETRTKATDDAMVDALKAFQARAAIAAQALGKQWRVKNINVSQGGGPQPYMRAMKVSMSGAADTATPIEAGEGSVTVTVNGSVELLD